MIWPLFFPLELTFQLQFKSKQMFRNNILDKKIYRYTFCAGS